MNVSSVDEPAEELDGHLKRWIQWFRFRQALTWAARGFVVGIGISLIVSTIALWQKMLLRTEFINVVVTFAVGGSVFGVIGAIFWPFPKLDAAKFFDQVFGLYERVSTAIELQSGENDGRQVPDWMKEHQLRDTIGVVNTVRPQTSLPLRVPRRELLASLILVFLIYLAWQQGDRFFQAAQQIRTREVAVQEEKIGIETLIQEIKDNPSINSTHQEEITQPLESAVKELTEADSLEQAVSALTKAREELENLTDEEVSNLQSNLVEAGEKLKDEDGKPLSEFGEQLSRGNFQEAADTLENINVDGLSPTQKKDLSEQVDIVAKDVAENNQELAEQLRSAAEEIRSGNMNGTQDSLQKAAQTMRDQNQMFAQAKAAQDAMARVDESAQRLLQTDQNRLAGQVPSGELNNPDQNPGLGVGQIDGEGGEEGNQVSDGSGSNKATNDESGVPLSEAGIAPISESNTPGDGGERSYEPLFETQQLSSGSGELLRLPSSGVSGGEIVGEGDVPPDDSGFITVPYADVFPNYEQAVNRAFDSGQIPNALRPLVRDYFGSLEP